MISKKTKQKVLKKIIEILKENPQTPYLLQFWRQLINQKLPDHYKITSTLEMARKFKTLQSQGTPIIKQILKTPFTTEAYIYKGGDKK
jgi:hypothetical protein